MNILADKTCNCDLDPMVSIMERNSESIVSLQYDLTNLNEELNSKFQINIDEVTDVKETVDDMQSNLDFVIQILARQAIFLKNLGYIEYETIEAVLKNSAQIDYIEGGLENFAPYSDETVIFSAERTEGGNFDGTITFDNSNINVGGGMDYQNGRFQTPLTGVYSFTFSGITGIGLKSQGFYFSYFLFYFIISFYCLDFF